jgi:hypothetical protein
VRKITEAFLMIKQGLVSEGLLKNRPGVGCRLVRELTEFINAEFGAGG